MPIDRRQLGLAGLFALGAAGELLRAAPALAEEDGGLAAAVEALRKAILAADKAQLEALTAPQLSYGHSDGRVQTKAEFIDGVVNRKARVKSLDFPELKLGTAGDAGIARHLYVSESEQDGKTNNVRIGVLAVWQNQDGTWKLLARQGYKLAA
ncbi:MAG TPA: nuclear transport factor 2 family protein [Stellaceae bacterium]|nr:nuclear transport factor 2 family protein [Stellaceae bacterium]